MLSIKFTKLSLSGLVISFMLLSGCVQEMPRSTSSSTRMLMGTFVKIHLISSEMTSKELEVVLEGTFSLASHLENKFSLFSTDSEINRLNREKRLKVSRSLLEVLLLAEEVRSGTRGKFDIAVGAKLFEQGFYNDMPQELTELIPRVKPVEREVFVNKETSVVEISSDMWLDLSGLAKGYIVDKLGEYLDDSGVDSFLVNAGGDMLCRAGKDKRDWKVGLRRPGSEQVELVFALKNKAVATSGDYENFIRQSASDAEVALSHIVDTTTGNMIKKRPSSVSVIANSCARADGLATGFMSMSPAEALESAEAMSGVEIVCLAVENGRTEKHSTSGAGEYILEGAVR